VPHKQPKRGRLRLNDSSCVRLRPEYPNHVWSYDFAEDRTHNGRKIRILNVSDEFTRESTTVAASRSLRYFSSDSDMYSAATVRISSFVIGARWPPKTVVTSSSIKRSIVLR